LKVVGRVFSHVEGAGAAGVDLGSDHVARFIRVRWVVG
jgi:hypothetical protein